MPEAIGFRLLWYERGRFFHVSARASILRMFDCDTSSNNRKGTSTTGFKTSTSR